MQWSLFHSSLCFPSNEIHNIHMKIESSDGWTIWWSDDWSLLQEAIWWFGWKSDDFARIWWIIRWLKKTGKSDDCAIWQSKHLTNEALMTEASDYWSIWLLKHLMDEASDYCYHDYWSLTVTLLNMKAKGVCMYILIFKACYMCIFQSVRSMTRNQTRVAV